MDEREFRLAPCLLLALGLLSAWPAQADDSTGQVINDLYDAFQLPIRQFGAALVASGVGTGLLASLLALHVIAAGLGLAAGLLDPFALVVRLLRLSLLAALVLATIRPQPWFVQLSGYETLGRALEAGFHQVMNAAAVAAQLPDTGDPGSMIRSVSNTVLHALFKMGEVQVFPAGTSMWKAMTNVTGLMIGLLMWFMCVVAYIIAGALVLGEAVIADLTIQIALAFAPLMVPWLLFAPLRFLFEAWLRTLLVGGVGFVIAILFCAGMAAFAGSADRALGQILQEPLINAKLIATFSPILIGSILMILMAAKVMSFANSLLSGGAPGSLSLGEFQGAGAATAQGSQSPGRAGQSIAGAAQGLTGGLQRGAGMVAAGLNQARAAWGGSQGQRSQGAQALARRGATRPAAAGGTQAERAVRNGNRAYSLARFAGHSHDRARSEAEQAVAAAMHATPSGPQPGSAARERLRDKAARFKAARRR